MRKYTIVLPLIIVVILSLGTFWGSWNIYFQQDEWNGFGNVLYAERYGYITLIRLYGSHLTPLTSLFFALLFRIFSFTHTYYGIYSIFLHSFNGFLVYLFTSELLNNRRIALLSSIIFITALVSQQTVTWHAASASFLPSAFFTLLSLFIFERYLKKSSIKLLYLSFLFACISLGFRENSIILFPYFIIRSWLFSSTSILRISIYSSVTCLFYMFLRFFPVFFIANTLPSTKPIVSIQELFFHISQLLTTSLPQMLIPKTYAIRFAYWMYSHISPFIELIYPINNKAVFIETTLTRGIYVCLFIFICITFIFFMKRNKSKVNHSAAILALCVFLLLSILPFSLLPRKLPMESRHFYIPTIAFSILISTIFSLTIKGYSGFKKWILISIVILYVLLNINSIKLVIQKATLLSDTRVIFIHQITSTYPTLPKQTIFFSEGDILPFQSGFGHLLTIIFNKQQSYHSFFKNNFLWNLKSQGYAEIDTVGFGYYHQFPLLIKEYCMHNLKPENVFAFSWDSKQKILTDTTSSIRTTLTCTFQAQ